VKLDSSFTTGLGKGLDDRGIWFRLLAREQFVSPVIRPAVRPHHSFIQWVPEDASLGIKRPAREPVSHNPPVGTLRMRGDIYLYSILCLHGVVLNYAQRNFTCFTSETYARGDIDVAVLYCEKLQSGAHTHFMPSIVSLKKSLLSFGL
jgi:hypothetical protein